jgi:hypothetical protein
MNRRLGSILLIIIVAAVFWHDLGSFFLQRAEQHYLAGNFSAARSDWHSALRLTNNEKTVRFNRGVGSYRLGEFKAALDDFSAAAVGSDPVIRYQSLYNQGNCLARLAEQVAASDRASAERLYDTALDRYRDALLLSPADHDIRSNQTEVAAARAAFLADVSAQQSKTKRPAASQSNTAPGGSKTADSRHALKTSAGRQSSQAASAQPDGAGSAKKGMGREQAERLLNEKRGQEVLPSAIKATAGGTAAAPPLKDW